MPALEVPAGLAGVPVDLQAEQLLAVVPLVQGPGLVDALVALQPDQPGAVTAATALASSVLPTPAGPSTSSGLPRRSARKTVVAVAASVR